MEEPVTTKKDALESLDLYEKVIKHGSQIKQRSYLEAVKELRNKVHQKDSNACCGDIVEKGIRLVSDATHAYEPIRAKHFLK